MSLDYGLCLGAEDREYTAEEFCSALHAVFGDGICKYGAGFGLTLGGFDLNISTGYAAAAGRYVKNTDTFTATLGPSSNTEDRYDALAVRVDYPGRRAALEVLQNVDPDAIRADPVLVRNSTEYCVILYFIHVRRGATTLSPNDVEDVRSDGGLCGNVVPLAEASGNVLYIYRYLTEGIDEKAGQLIQDSERILQKAADAVERIDAILEDKGITPVIGEVRTAVEKPLPDDEWLLCSGGTVPPEHIGLMIVIGGTLPDIQMQDGRVKAYMYAGNSSGDIPEGMCLIYASPNDIAYGKISGSGLVQLGASVTLTAAPNTGYKFTAWQENGQTVSRDRAYTFTATGNRALTAVFEAAATIAVSIDPPGGGSASGGGTYDIGTSVTVTAAPASGYLFVAWKEGGETVSSNRTYTFTAERSRRLTAVFAVACTVSASVDPSGSGSVSGAGTYPQGAVVTVTAAAGNGYRFAAWKENGVTVSTSASYAFAVTGNRSLTAVFVAVYSISVSASPAGGGTVSGAGVYDQGEAVTVTATPGSAYNFFAWKEGSSSVSTEASYTFTANKNRNLVALFEVIQYVAGVDWWQSKMPASGIWAAVAYGNGKFVAVDRENPRVAYSTDGINWSLASLPSDASGGSMASVTYGNGKFVAVPGAGGNAVYSSDGVNWKQTALPSYKNWYQVTYGNGKFVAISSNIIAYSTDGITWKTPSSVPSSGVATIAYGNGKFVIIGKSSTGLYSTDGINWSTMTVPYADWACLGYGGGKFVAISRINKAGETTGKSAYSSDGINWTESTLPFSYFWEEITYGDGKFVVVGRSTYDKVLYSANGVNWNYTTLPRTPSTGLDDIAGTNWLGVAYGNGKFVAVAGDTDKSAYSKNGTALS